MTGLYFTYPGISAVAAAAAVSAVVVVVVNPGCFQVYPGITGFEPWFSSFAGRVTHFRISRFDPTCPAGT